MSKLTRFRTELNALGFDGAIISCKENQYYLSDFNFDDGYVVVTNKKGYVITDSRYEEVAHLALDQNPEFEILLGGIKSIVEILKNDGCTSVAFEEEHLSVRTYYYMEGKITEACGSIIDAKNGAKASSLLTKLRINKTPEEIENIKKAQALTDAAFSHLCKVIKRDMTEIEVALELELHMRKNGADGLAFDTIAVNAENSSRPHGVPSTAKLKDGFLTLDFGARFNGYCSDMTRTVVIGKADEEMKHLYNTVLTAQKMAIEAAKYGMKCVDIDKVARDHIYANGYEGKFGHGLGHGVGLFIHEAPRLSPMAGDVTLDVGHVVTVEPGIYLPGKYGCRIEDMIYVNEDKQVIDLTHSAKELIELL